MPKCRNQPRLSSSPRQQVCLQPRFFPPQKFFRAALDLLRYHRLRFLMSNRIPSTASIPPLLEALRAAPTAPDAKSAANALAREIQSSGLTLLKSVFIYNPDTSSIVFRHGISRWHRSKRHRKINYIASFNSFPSSFSCFGLLLRPSPLLDQD